MTEVQVPLLTMHTCINMVNNNNNWQTNVDNKCCFVFLFFPIFITIMIKPLIVDYQLLFKLNLLNYVLIAQINKLYGSESILSLTILCTFSVRTDWHKFRNPTNMCKYKHKNTPIDRLQINKNSHEMFLWDARPPLSQVSEPLLKIDWFTFYTHLIIQWPLLLSWCKHCYPVISAYFFSYCPKIYM